MTQEQENFYRHSTVIVDETKDSFLHLLDFHLTNQGITLQRFIEIYEHEIYHMCFNRYPCCQCPPGTRPYTSGSRILHPPQLDIFLDPSGRKLPGHNPGSISAPHCCCPVNPNLKLDDLDFSLARLLLVNFTTVVPQGSHERNALDSLVNSRNHSFAHAKEGKISNSDFQKSFADIEKSLLVLAKVYGKEAETKQRLSDITKQPLNVKICMQLQNTLLQQCRLEDAINKMIAEKTLPDCLTKDLSDVTVMEGCDAHFKTSTINDGFSALWSKDGSEIINTQKFITGKAGTIHSLTIMNTCLSDQGLYTVRLNNIERRAYLDVKEYFTKNLQSIDCIEGDTAELTCEVIEDSLPARWNKNGIYLENDGKYEILQVGKIHRLSIKKCDLHDAGNYTVNINNRVRTTSLTLIEYFTKPLETRSCTEGETVQFECEVLDDNQTAKWFKDGTELITPGKYKVERHGKHHRLVISNTKPDDMGEYLITIKNCVRRTELIVREIPKAIQQLSKEDKELYLEIIKTGTETRYYIRIVIIGENGVGKTCLLRRLLRQSIKGVLSTDGVEIHRCQINPSNGQWIFNGVSDTKKTLLSRLKKAIQSSSRNENPTHSNYSQKSYQATGLISHGSISESPDTTYNTIGEVLDKNHNSSETKQMTTHDMVVISKLEDQTSTKVTNLTENLKVEMRSHSQLQHNTSVTKLLTEKVLHGLDSLLIEIENVDVPADMLVECGILDFAGEKDYYATHPIFLNPNAIHLLVTNIMKDVEPINIEDGFNRIGGYVDFWLDTIHSCCVEEETMEETKEEILYPPVIIVGTRIDECRDRLHERKDVYRKELLSLLRNETKRKHVRDICYVSNTESAEEDFHALRETIFEYGKQVKTFAENLPLKWIRLEQSLDILREAELNIISWPDIVELSAKCSIDSEDEINLFLKYQHKVGGVIYFESLKEYIILNQKWLANAFRCLVSDKFDSNLKLTDEWKALEDTGKLEHSLIAKLFDKEPKLDFNKHSGHLLNIMEIFGIIVKLSMLVDNGQRQILPTYYMPCMISEKASCTDIIDMFNAKKDNCKRTPWLCIEFNFMPFDFFNHILCYYISKYAICTEPHTARMAIYHGMGVFFLDHTKFRKFILCFCKNTIALQIWQWNNIEDGKCKAMLTELRLVIETVKERFETRKVSCTEKLKCPDGNIHKPVGRHSYNELVDLGDEYFCEEHNDIHSKQDFFQTWFEDYIENENHVTVQLKLKDHEGINDIRFQQKCRHCEKALSVYWCHDCLKSMCRDCNNRHRESIRTEDHIVEHVHDMYSLDYKFHCNVLGVISDIKVLPDELLVIAVNTGKQLLTFDITGQQTIPLPGTSYCIAVVDNNTVAVTLYTFTLLSPNTVAIVDVRRRRVIEHIDMRMAINGIMYREEQLFVCCADKTIKVVNMSWNITHIIPVSLPMYICGGEAGLMYYTDWNKLYCINTVGDTLFAFTDPNMNEPCGITTDDEGYVLVICRESKNVLRISPDGKQSQVIIAQVLTSFNSNYTNICYDSQSTSVVIGYDGYVFVYKKV